MWKCVIDTYHLAKLLLIFFKIYFWRHNLLYYTVSNELSFDVVFHIKMIFRVFLILILWEWCCSIYVRSQSKCAISVQLWQWKRWKYSEGHGFWNLKCLLLLLLFRIINWCFSFSCLALDINRTRQEFASIVFGYFNRVGYQVMISQWGSTIKLSWVQTVTSQYPPWYDHICC